MKISILTMFPAMFSGLFENPLVQRALKLKELELNIVDIKEHTKGSFRKIDDSPYGGGKGMILRVDSLCNALNSVKTEKSHVVLFSPKGRTLNQQKVKEFLAKEELVLVCGHYEGIDARFEDYADEQISIGDYILSGGENAAMVVCDSIVRLLLGVLKDGCADEESFENGLIEHRQYTHPDDFEGKKVPEVLLSGNKKEIDLYKQASSLMETAKYRPDLLYQKAKKDKVGMSESDVLLFDNFVMKVNHTEQEYLIYNWLSNKVKTPKIFNSYQNGISSYLLMEKLKGRMLCSQYFYERPKLLIKTVCEALKTIWSVDTTGCPFDSSPFVKLKIAKENIDKGCVKIDPDCGFNSPQELYLWLESNIPTDYEKTFTHGDFCLPNIFVSKKGIISFIDVGLAGVGDRYCDIAICLRSLKFNADGKYDNGVKQFEFKEEDFFKEMGISPDYSRIRWYTLLDELF